MEKSREHDQLIALAAMFQALDQVRQIATTGLVDSQTLETSLQSILVLDSDSAEAVFGGTHNLRNGLAALRTQLAQPQNLDVTRYAAHIFALERKLAKRPDMLEKLGKGVEDVKGRLSYFPILHENIVAGLADLYLSTISNLGKRIMVQGSPNHLQNPINSNRIRALLLSAVRAAVLWRQKGGGRLQFVLKRKQLIAGAEQLLKESEHQPIPVEKTE